MLRNTLFIIVSFFLFFITSCEKHEGQKVATTPTNDSIDLEENVINNFEWTKNAIIYEVNIRQFSKEGDFNAVIDELPRIKDLGVNIISLLPIHPIGKKNRLGELGDPYAIKDFKKVNPEFGNLEDFKNLVNKAHELDIKVIIDWVAYQSSIDNKWVKQVPEFYIKDSLGQPTFKNNQDNRQDLASFDLTNPALRDSLQMAMKYWVSETDIDGFKASQAEILPISFWKDTRTKLDSIKPLFMLAEGNNAELYEAFDMTYGTHLNERMLEISDKHSNFAGILNYLSERAKVFQPKDLIMYYTNNYRINTYQYLEIEQFGQNLKNYNSLTFLLGGMPLIYSGQEAGFTKKLNPYEKDTIEWRGYENSSYFKQMSSVYKNNPALWNNGDRAKYEVVKAENQGLYFIIEKNDELIAVLQNYSNYEQYVSTISLNGFNITTNLINNSPTNVSERGIEIPPHSTIIIGQNK